MSGQHNYTNYNEAYARYLQQHQQAQQPHQPTPQQQQQQSPAPSYHAGQGQGYPPQGQYHLPPQYGTQYESALRQGHQNGGAHRQSGGYQQPAYQQSGGYNQPSSAPHAPVHQQQYQHQSQQQPQPQYRQQSHSYSYELSRGSAGYQQTTNAAYQQTSNAGYVQQPPAHQPPRPSTGCAQPGCAPQQSHASRGQYAPASYSIDAQYAPPAPAADNAWGGQTSHEQGQVQGQVQHMWHPYGNGNSVGGAGYPSSQQSYPGTTAASATASNNLVLHPASGSGSVAVESKNNPVNDFGSRPTMGTAQGVANQHQSTSSTATVNAVSSVAPDTVQMEDGATEGESELTSTSQMSPRRKARTCIAEGCTKYKASRAEGYCKGCYKERNGGAPPPKGEPNGGAGWQGSTDGAGASSEGMGSYSGQVSQGASAKAAAAPTSETSTNDKSTTEKARLFQQNRAKSYNCSKCGAPKKGHKCPLEAVNGGEAAQPESKDAAVAVSKDPSTSAPASNNLVSNPASGSGSIAGESEKPVASSVASAKEASAGNAAAQKKTSKPAIDKTSTEYLQTLLAKPKPKRSLPQNKRSSAPALVSPKEIVIPAEFSPSHTYRATAAYSLLRTLSIELRLSPFTLQSFMNALMLPVPSRLLGEIHVRVLRLLFADIGMGSYSKLGEIALSKIPRRQRKTGTTKNDKIGLAGKEGLEEVREASVARRAGDNLTFLDGTTWPLFYEDYARAREDKLLGVLGLLDEDSDGDGGDEFIDMRSVAMLPSEEIDLAPDNDPYRSERHENNASRAMYVNRCPAGPLGYRNSMGRFVCCPFHVAAAVQMYRPMHPPAATAAKPTVKSSGKKRGRPPKKKRGRPPKKGKPGRRKSRSNRDDSSSSSESEFSEQDDSDDDDYPSPSKNQSRASYNCSKCGAPKKGHICPLANIPAGSQQPAPLSSPGSRVSNVEYASPERAGSVVAARPSAMGLPTVHRPAVPPAVAASGSAASSAATGNINGSLKPTTAPQSTGAVDITKPDVVGAGPATVSKRIAPPQAPPGARAPLQTPAIPNKPPPQCQGAVAPRPPQQPIQPTQPQQMPPSVLAMPPMRPVVVPPVPLPPADESAVVVSDQVEKTFERFFSGATSPKTAKEPDSVMVAAECDEASSSKCSDGDRLLAHMAPLRQLAKGVPYHRLGVDVKLTMIEFLLDEVLQVDEVRNELALRHATTSEFEFPFGKPPLPKELEEMYNADECTICGLEGDLLCCDGCPGSFHRQCAGLGDRGRLPEGKWLCPECKISDASKMGPLGAERRPLVGWFTLRDIVTELSEVIAQAQPSAGGAVGPAGTGGPDRATVVSGNPSGIAAPPPNPNDPSFSHLAGVATAPPPNPSGTPSVPNATTTTLAVAPAESNNASVTPVSPVDSAMELIQRCNIPADVEFLVTPTQIFARYRSSLEPYDPLFPSVQDGGTKQGLVEPPPPSPLTARQLQELVKLLGPKVCLALPWLRVPFEPVRLFPAIAALANLPAGLGSDSVANLRSLSAHQTESRRLLLSNSEQNNPMVYFNSYRKAPPAPTVKAHQGSFLYPTNPTSDGYQYSAGRTTALSVALVDLTIPRSHSVRVPYVDPVKSVRDKMIRMERSLYNACLLDFRWGSGDGEFDSWRQKVENANSVGTLASLLISLVDACSLKAFLSEWYQPTGENSEGVGRRVSRTNGDSKDSAVALPEGWTPEQESSRRKWERCEGNEIRRLFDGLAALLNRGAPNKRRKRSVSDDDNATKDPNRPPKRNVSAYILYSSANRERVKTENPGAMFGDIVKILSVEFKQLSESEKAHWDQLAAADKERYQREMEAYEAPSESDLNERKKDPIAETASKDSAQTTDHGSLVPQSVSDAVKMLVDETVRRNPGADLAQSNANPATQLAKLVANGEEIARSAMDESKAKADVDAPLPQTDPGKGPGLEIKPPSDPQPSQSQNEASACNLVSSSDASPSNNVETEAQTVDTPTKRRSRGCGKCEMCLQEDCRECVNCLDMKKYGGPDKLRKKCLRKKQCLMLDDVMPAEVNAPAKKKSTQKKRRKRDSLAAPSSRRRSDRLNIIRHQLESLLGITEAEGSKTEQAIATLQLDKFEKVLTNDDKPAVYWAIAGKKLFEPSGAMSRSLVKRLARNSGSLRAPSITYDTSYEVGEAAVCHHWRKQTMSCTTFEGLLYSLRVLDAHVNSAVTISAGNIASRKASSQKSSAATAIRCVHTDPLIGFTEYFVVTGVGKRGFWHSEETVDLSALIHYRFEKRRPFAEKREQLDRERRMKEATERLKQMEAAKRKTPSTSVTSNPTAKRARNDALLSHWERELVAATSRHRDETVLLLRASAERGEATVPQQKMAQSRMKNVGAMRTAAQGLRQAGGKMLSESDLTSRMAKAEAEGVQLYIKDMQKQKATALLRKQALADTQRKPASAVPTQPRQPVLANAAQQALAARASAPPASGSSSSPAMMKSSAAIGSAASANMVGQGILSNPAAPVFSQSAHTAQAAASVNNVSRMPSQPPQPAGALHWQPHGTTTASYAGNSLQPSHRPPQTTNYQPWQAAAAQPAPQINPLATQKNGMPAPGQGPAPAPAPSYQASFGDSSTQPPN